MNEPWSKQINESSKSYKAFRTYLELGVERSIDKAYRVFRGLQNSTKTAPRHWTKWSVRFNWVSRAQDFDAHIHTLELQRHEEETKAQGKLWVQRRDALREQEIFLAEELMKQAKYMLSFPLTRQTISKDGRITTIEPASWKKSDVPKFIELAHRLQRLSLEMETDHLLFDIGSVVDKVAETFIEVIKEIAPHLLDPILEGVKQKS